MAVSRRVTRVAAVTRGWDETRRGSAATPADPGPVDPRMARGDMSVFRAPGLCRLHYSGSGRLIRFPVNVCRECPLQKRARRPRTCYLPVRGVRRSAWTRTRPPELKPPRFVRLRSPPFALTFCPPFRFFFSPPQTAKQKKNPSIYVTRISKPCKVRTPERFTRPPRLHTRCTNTCTLRSTPPARFGVHGDVPRCHNLPRGASPPSGIRVGACNLRGHRSRLQRPVPFLQALVNT